MGFQKGHPRFNKITLRGEDHPNWAGDDIKYISLHNWVKQHLGKAKECVHCGMETSIKPVEWASISHEAKRDLNDFISLCKKCHGLYDKYHRKINLYSNNISGFSGVGFHKETNKWRARYGQINLGLFQNIGQAIEVRQKYILNFSSQ